jgi:hypothetical protein
VTRISCGTASSAMPATPDSRSGRNSRRCA